ncbi:MAG: amino acid permease [Bacteroidota bacterium]|nr:amino acid permease [Bacteroidota bacterium]MDP4232509.1 amino acid permease [Bacteroidota bacterium]MDP4241644.1 amino acid permease [Bacteroidota bacterium]MDP4286389.1 amino acid permease [Bacteroidota bacterium]
MADSPKLLRSLTLRQATAINMIDMVGIGPFVTMALVIDIMAGPQCIVAWLLGALLAVLDAMVWSELGARWPEAGGSFIFLRKLYGENSWGRFFSFLFIWQTVFQAPLVVASGSIGFAEHVAYLIPLSSLERRMVSGALVILITFALYRRITTAGRISVVLWGVLILTIGWILFAGATHFDPKLAFTYPSNAFSLTPIFFIVLGQAMGKSVYSFLGYYNVCHLGAEIQQPEKNIPRSMFISVLGIAAIYIAMQLSVLGTLPWQEARHSSFVFSLMFERIYGETGAQIVTVLILVIASASLFSALLGYSRIPYAAAKEGAFFPIFARVHPTKNFPHVSLLVMGALGFIFGVFFNRMSDVISAILAMRILVQFTGQTLGLVLWHRSPERVRDLPYRMPFFPVPAILSILIWLFVFYFTGLPFISGALGVIAVGVVVFLVRSKVTKEWPYAVPVIP